MSARERTIAKASWLNRWRLCGCEYLTARHSLSNVSTEGSRNNWSRALNILNMDAQSLVWSSKSFSYGFIRSFLYRDDTRPPLRSKGCTSRGRMNPCTLTKPGEGGGNTTLRLRSMTLSIHFCVWLAAADDLRPNRQSMTAEIRCIIGWIDRVGAIEAMRLFKWASKTIRSMESETINQFCGFGIMGLDIQGSSYSRRPSASTTFFHRSNSTTDLSDTSNKFGFHKYHSKWADSVDNNISYKSLPPCTRKFSSLGIPSHSAPPWARRRAQVPSQILRRAQVRWAILFPPRRASDRGLHLFFDEDGGGNYVGGVEMIQIEQGWDIGKMRTEFSRRNRYENKFLREEKKIFTS